MPRINLLPWRDTLKKEREIRFGIITGASLVLTGLVVLSAHLYMGSLIDHQQRRNNYLNAEIEKAKAKISEIDKLKEDKERLIKRMDVIQVLEESRPQVVHLFDELVKQAPDGVYFSSIKQKGDKITLEGVAQSNARVSSLMKNIERSQWLSNPKIIFIKTQKNNRRSRARSNVSRFKLEVMQTAPKREVSP
jgi:type IV pilus assembly protein PilN